MLGLHDGLREMHFELHVILYSQVIFPASLAWQAQHRRSLSVQIVSMTTARRLPPYADWPGIGETVNLDHIKCGYYAIETLNPTKIVPVGPDLAEIFRA